MRKHVFRVSDTNRTVQPQKMARGLKFRIKKVVGLHYVCSKKKGVDQLSSSSAADQKLLFSHMKKQVFSSRCSL